MIRSRLLGLGLAGTALVGGCAENNSHTYYSPEPIYQQVFDFEGSSWPIECYGPVKEIKAKSGDMLVQFILKLTDVHQPAALGRADIPERVIEMAVAEINHLPSPDEIQANHKYKIPSACQLQG